MKGNGGIIGAENIPTPETASGIWSLRQIYNAVTDEIWPVSPNNDPLFQDVSLLMKGDGTSITDLSPQSNTITAYGTAQTDTSIKKYGTGSIKFDGLGPDSAYLRAPDNVVDFGTSDFTIEFWIYPLSYGPNQYARTIFDARPYRTNGSYLSIYYDVDRLSISSNGNTASVDATSNYLALNEWSHVAITRSSGTGYLFKNGSLLASNAFATDLLSATELRISQSAYATSSVYGIDGYLDDVRITKNIARYTSSFTPPGSLPTQ